MIATSLTKENMSLVLRNQVLSAINLSFKNYLYHKVSGIEGSTRLPYGPGNNNTSN